MKTALLIPVFSFLFLSCVDQSDPDPDTLDERTEYTDTLPEPQEETRSRDSIYSTRMEAWANTYAADLGTDEHPGFLDLWWAYGGDIDGDGDVDSVGLFSMSAGGNAVEQYAAVFLQSDTGLAFDAVQRIGWRPEIVTSVESIGEGRIKGKTLVWRDDDGQCCPSDSGRMVLTWEPGELATAPNRP